MTDYRFQRLSKENIFALVILYKRAFGINVSAEFLQKKYDTEKLGVAHIGIIAFLKDTPVAYYGVIPSLMQIDGKHLLAAQSADTMTDPDHRRRGLFKSLAEKAYDLARNSGIEFIYGFPNEASYPGFVKLGWKFLPQALQLFKSEASYSAATLLNATGLINGHHRLLHRLGTSPAQLFQDYTASSVLHDQNFIDYKKYNSTHFISLEGSLLWLKAGKSLKVGLAVPAEGVDVKVFVSKLNGLASRLGCRDIFFITHHKSPLYNFLQPAITPANAFPVGIYHLGPREIDYAKLKFEYCDIDSF